MKLTALFIAPVDKAPGDGLAAGCLRIDAPPRPYVNVRLSPDGTRVVFTSWADLTGVFAQYNQLYIRDLSSGTTSLLTVNAAGGPSDYGVGTYALSPDGTKVAFSSNSTNLVATDTNGEGDVFVRDLQTGMTTLVSGNADGSDSGNARSGGHAFSPDGSTIAFTSFASNLGPRDSNATTDVYVRDVASGTTSLVTVNAGRTDATGGSNPVFGPTGRRVAFVSESDGLGPVDTNGSDDVYLRDLSRGLTSLVSANVEGTDSGDGWSAGPGSHRATAKTSSP